MAHRNVVVCFACCFMGCGSTATTRPNAPSSETTDPGSSTARSKNSGKESEVSQWSEVPQNEPASLRSVIGGRKSEVIVVSNPKSHGEALHFQFTVNSVALSGVFSAHGRADLDVYDSDWFRSIDC